jgi:signal peptidase I
VEWKKGFKMDFDFDKESKRPQFMRIFIEIFIWAAEIAAVIFLAYFIVYYALEKTEMVGISMEPTLNDKDEIIINKFSYRFTEPKRFDVIVFKQSGKEHSFYDTKRIIALPGETIQIKDGQIYINGKVVKDIVNVDTMNNYGLADEEITLEANEYFVLGDNRNNSEDSRFASVGMIRRDEIIGKAFIRVKPFNFVSKMNLKEDTKAEE